MHHRDGMRPRQIDDNKQNMIIKDLAEAKKKAIDNEQLNKINDKQYFMDGRHLSLDDRAIYNRFI